MKTIVLSKNHPTTAFNFPSATSSLLIEKVVFKRTNKNETVLSWSDFASRVELRATLTYTVYNDAEGRFEDERTEEVVIPLIPNVNEVDPVIHLNHRIENRTFTLGTNPQQHYFNRLSLEVINAAAFSEDFILELFVEEGA